MVTMYDMSYIDAMDGHEFEHFVAKLLQKLAYENVEVTRGSGDQGVDILAEKEGVRYAIQCKCYSSDLGNTPVQEVNTGRMIYHCHVGVVVTNRYFTQGAMEAAKATGVLLWNRDKLRSLIAQIQGEFDAEPLAQQSENPLTLWSENSLIRRGRIALKDGEWKKAGQFFDRALNSDPENAEAYLGLALAEAELPDIDDFAKVYINEPVRLREWNQNNLRHAKEFAGPKLSAWFTNLDLRCQKMKIQDQQARKEFAMRMEPLWETLRNENLIAAGDGWTIGSKEDDTVVATEYIGDKTDYFGQCNVTSWRDIMAVATGWGHTVGLKVNGTVVAVGYNTSGQCNVTDWKDIIRICAGNYHTVGLRMDGTVVAVGNNDDGQCNVSGWRDIVSVAAGEFHTVGLQVDGTVVAVGDNDDGQCNVSSWQDIIMIAAGYDFTVGLKSDGTVITTDEVTCQRNTTDWQNIVSIFTSNGGDCHIFGLRSDGVVISETDDDDYDGSCDVGSWRDIIMIAAGYNFTVGLKADGTLVTTKYKLKYYHGECNIADWKLFDNLKALMEIHRKRQDDVRSCMDEKRKQRAEKDKAERKCREAALIREKSNLEAEIVKKITALETEQTALRTELANLKGLFVGRRRREIGTRLAEIEIELKNEKGRL